MDIVYLFKHSPYNDFEIRYSLRSVEMHAPYIGKVWIFGDRPAFITSDTTRIEHVPDTKLARILRVQTPVGNSFLLTLLSSLIPALSFEYLRFSDDFFLLKDFPIEEARKTRYYEDLNPPHVAPRGSGIWQQTIWQTCDILLRLGYTAYNFEIHAPMYFTRKRVMDAYCNFRDFVSEDRWFGMSSATAILNHAYKVEGMKLYSIVDEQSRGGLWGRPPDSMHAVHTAAEGKTFFNFDDHAFCDPIARFLHERFPRPSCYENV